MKKALRVIAICVLLTFSTTQIIFPLPSTAYAQTVMDLPVPGTMLNLTAPFTPPILRGLTIHPENPFRFDFIVDKGETGLKGDELKKEYERLIKYFLATLTIPEDDLWVNLSPYEKERIIPQEFGLTEMGRDLLAQDYILKQLMASLTYPDSGLGKKFWDEVYKKAYEQYGTTNIPLNTFNKVWIVPDKAVVYQNKDKAFIVESHLKVMLEEDYLALEKNLKNEKLGTNRLEENKVQAISSVTSKITKEILIPAIEKEVNEGKNFANLRQIFQSMILAVWYKDALKDKLLNRVYSNRKKIEGVNADDPKAKEKIYQQYIDAFKVGVYNYIKEDYDVQMNQNIPRKYFSGGFNWPKEEGQTRTEEVDNASLTGAQKEEVKDNPCTHGRCENVAMLAVNPRADKINNGQPIPLKGNTVAEALKNLWYELSLEERKLIFDSYDPQQEQPPKIKQFIFAAVNDEDVRFWNSTDQLPENAQITFIPAIAGGGDSQNLEENQDQIDEPQLGKDNTYARAINNLINGSEVTQASRLRMAVLKKVGPKIEQFIQNYFSNPNLRIAIIPLASTLKGYAIEDSDIDYAIYILDGLDSNIRALRQGQKSAILDELTKLIRAEGFQPDSALMDSFPLINFSDVTHGIFKHISRQNETYLTALAHIFLPIAYGDKNLIEKIRYNVIDSFHNQSDRRRESWDKIQEFYWQVIEILSADLSFKPQLKEWLVPQGVDEGYLEEYLQASPYEKYQYGRRLETYGGFRIFYERRKGRMSLPNLEAMVQIYLNPTASSIGIADEKSEQKKDVLKVGARVRTRNGDGRIKQILAPDPQWGAGPRVVIEFDSGGSSTRLAEN